ncbi:START domain-containing protein 10-like isoform X1 [Caretta caretta]|uniref:START domain-containing protein 10-like isoform X1 n=2 Tax=Cheloniidae TaxID=8465 RepID=UPI003D45BA50
MLAAQSWHCPQCQGSRAPAWWYGLHVGQEEELAGIGDTSTWCLVHTLGGVQCLGQWSCGPVEAAEKAMRSPLHERRLRIACKDVPAATLYDVLHDTHYRKKWDSNVIETYDIGRLTANADVGYYAWKCPSPLKNRDFVTLRSWLPLGNDYMIINYSVKHPKYPPRKDFVRAVSLQTGYLVRANGPHGCTLYYLTQVDPRGSLPKWVVNKVSQFVAPKAMKKIYKAGLKYREWKQKHEPGFKPWVYPEQNMLPSISLAELSLQHADSLENIDESGLAEDRTHISDDEA